MRDSSSPPSLWQGQVLNLIGILVLVPLAYVGWLSIGKPFPFLFWACVLIPILHQVYVWLTWRKELQSKAISKSIGFVMYKRIFFVLLISRPLTALTLGYLDMGSLGMGLIPQVLLCVLFVAPAIYTFYSIKQYFGMERAFGVDHFEEKYRKMPLVKQGIFQYTDNAMYLFGFCMFWAIGFGFNSSAALIIAAYAHLSIWLHYFGTEKPDMVYLYGD